MFPAAFVIILAHVRNYYKLEYIFCMYLFNKSQTFFTHTNTPIFFFNFSVVRSTYLLMKIIKPLRQNNKFRNLKKGNLFRSFCWRATVQDSKSPPKLKQRPKVEIPEIRPLSKTLEMMIISSLKYYCR